MVVGKSDKITKVLVEFCRNIILDKEKVCTDEAMYIYNEVYEMLCRTVGFYSKSYTEQSIKDFERYVVIFNDCIPTNTKYIPFYFVNEVLGAWFTDHGKHFDYWQKFDFTKLYNHLKPEVYATRDAMHDAAELFLARIQGKKIKKRKQKALNLLSLKRLEIETEHNKKIAMSKSSSKSSSNLDIRHSKLDDFPEDDNELWDSYAKHRSSKKDFRSVR